MLWCIQPTHHSVSVDSVVGGTVREKRERWRGREREGEREREGGRERVGGKREGKFYTNSFPFRYVTEDSWR